MARRALDARASAARLAARADPDLRSAPRLVGARARGGQPLAGLSGDRAAARGAREVARLHAHRAAAGDGAPVLRLVGLSGHRVLRAVVALWLARRLPVLRGH